MMIGQTRNAVADIRASGLFDPEHYRAAANLLTKDTDLLAQHYLDVGDAAGHAPHPVFDPAWYRARAGITGNALLHYIAQGSAKSGASPHPLFDQRFYLAHSGAEVPLGQTPLAHYLTYGWQEYRDPHPLFSVAWYLSKNADVAALCYDPLRHFLSNGWFERRSPCPDFDCGYYVDHCPDVAAQGTNPLIHFIEHGVKEGRNPSASFDTKWYAGLLRHHPATEDENPLVHYLRVGRAEGYLPRQVSFELNSDGMLKRADYDMWSRNLFAQLRGLAMNRPRRRLVWITDSVDGPDVERVAPEALVEWLGRREQKNDPALVLLFTQPGDQLRPEAIDVIAAAFTQRSTLIMTFDAVCSEGDAAVLPVLLPGSNPAYLLHTNVVPPFCVDGVFCRDHRPADSQSPRDGAVLLEWFRSLVRAAATLSTRAIRHLPITAAEVPWQRHCPADAATLPEVVRTAVSVCDVSSQVASCHDTVSVVICTKNAGHLLTQLVLGLIRPKLPQIREVILVVNGPSNGFANAYHRLLSQMEHVRIVDYPGDYNFSDQCNAAARQATGTFLLFLNDDIVPVGNQWLPQMMSSIADAQVAVVGPLLLYPNETVQHAGMFLGFNNVAGHTLRGSRLPYQGTGAGLVTANCSAVTGAVMLVRADIFQALNGFDYQLATYLQDVDLCLRVLSMGWEVIFNPHAVLFHMESTSMAAILSDTSVNDQRGREHERFTKRWGISIFTDPYRSVHWSRQHEGLNTLQSVDSKTLWTALNG